MVRGATTSRHCVEDRENRLLFIAENVGFGEEVAESYDSIRKAWSSVTTTGVIFVRSKDKKKIVTAFLGTKNQVLKILGDTINPQVMNAVKYNMKKNFLELQNRA